jgi:MFS superfamily sulfate permease-like transporter
LKIKTYKTAYLPIATMVGVILVIAYNLIDFHHIRETLSFICHPNNHLFSDPLS